MSILTISLHPVSDADTSAAITQLVLHGPAAHGNTNGLPYYPGHYPSSSDAMSGLDAGHISGTPLLPSTATSDAIHPHVLHDEFVQLNWGGSYTSTFSSLSNAFGDEWQVPAHPPPSPNPSTTSTSGRSDHELSSSTFESTSSSLDDALGQDWLFSPLPLPWSSPSTPGWQQPVLIAPTPPPTIINPGLPLQTAALYFPASRGNHSLPTVGSFSPQIEEKNQNNLISHQTGGNPICNYGLAVEQTIIRQRGRGTKPSKKTKTPPKSPIRGVKRKTVEPSKIPRKFMGKFRARQEPKLPRDNNRGRRWDLEDWQATRA